MHIFHTLTVHQILKNLQTSQHGLTTNEAKKRLKKFGLNELTKKNKSSIFILFLNQFKSPLVYVLLASSIVAFFLESRLDAAVILLVVLCNALFGLMHELKASKALEALAQIINLRAKVKRDGSFLEISSSLIVPGDIIDIKDGMKIPADMRVIESCDIKVDEASLTGESDPVVKKEIVMAEDVNLGDRVNMLYAGTMVISGSGLGVVVATGDTTEFGHIAQEVSETEDEETLLQKQLSVFSKRLLVVVVIACCYIFSLGIINEIHYLEMVMVAIAVAISIIPEGLPALITITLAFGAFKMAKRKAIVRRLSAIETLGSITVIASDKTGTITHNQQTVEKIFTGQRVFSVKGSGYKPEGEILEGTEKINVHKNPDLVKMITLGAMCNNAKIFEKKNEWGVEGDPTEGALICLAGKVHIDKEILDKKLPKIDEIPFENQNAFMVTLHKSKDKNLIVVKGAIEKILNKSTYLFKNGKKIKINKNIRSEVTRANEIFAKQALRIIAVGYKEINKNKKTVEVDDLNDLTFVGLAGMIDPPRDEAIAAIADCKKSGIRPIMITGDYPLTAQTIAHDIGITMDSLDKAVSGQDLEKMSKTEFSKTVKHVSVFARISPEMKYKIVEELQQQGEIVAVTGDGINDAPALKKADIGVAMGEGGTDVSREVADLILVDNNFATIVAAIEEGRTIFQNIRRTVFYLLSTNAGELIVIALGLSLGWPLLLLPVQILWMNLVTDGTANLALAMEPTHQGLMKYKPRNPKEPILNSLILWRILIVSSTMAFLVFFAYGYGVKNGLALDHTRTIIFSILVVTQIYNIFNARSLKDSIFKMSFFSNPYIAFSVIASFFLSISTIYFGFMRVLFKTTDLYIRELLIIMAISVIIIFVVEIEKFLRRRFGPSY